MNKELWNKIVKFSFDNPQSEYGFSTRLGHENFWTKEFTDQAILEYKKFMYLAATSEFMISPSEIIDKVWHQHLIHTQSYNDFCTILGRQIQHIPSTHNREEFEKFRKAKERTGKLYERFFGQQPREIWDYTGMFESLNLEKAKFKIRTFVIFGILAAICLTVPAFFLLKPIYVQIDNPDFILALITLTIMTLLSLELYNRSVLKNIVSGFDSSSFINNLQPFELVYLKSQKLTNVINGTVNELIDNGTIKINENNSIELAKKSSHTLTSSQLQVTAALSELGVTYYPILVRKLASKPIFRNIPNSMDAFRKYFNKSKKFGALYYTNFSILTLLFLISFSRIAIGILRDRPVMQVIIVTIVLVMTTVIFLQRLTQQISTTTIPDLYKKKILPSKEIENNWQWNYFLQGTTVFTASFLPLLNQIDKNQKNNSCGTNCGSSCGSSCSSCGGCGSD